MTEHSTMILTAITEHERFWLDVIRIASRETDPAPTLERAQKLRRLFSEENHDIQAGAQ